MRIINLSGMMRNTLAPNQQLASSESFRHLRWSLSDTFVFLSKNFTSDFEQIEQKEREFFFVYTSYIFSRFFLLKLKILELEEVLPFVYVFRESRIVFLSIRRSHFKIWSNLYKAIVLTKITITCFEICKQQVKQVYSYF